MPGSGCRVLNVCTMSMLLSPAQAALVAGVSRWTVVRAINAQSLRAIRDNRNAWRIKSEDLEAWRSAQGAQGAHTEHEQPPAPLAADEHPSAPPVAQVDAGAREEAAELRAEVRVLHAKLTMLEDRLAREQEVSGETISDLRKRLDQEQEERRTLQRQIALPAQQPPQTAQEWPSERLEAPDPPKAPKGFLSRLLGR